MKTVTLSSLALAAALASPLVLADPITGVYSGSSDSAHINVGPNLLPIPAGPHADGIWKPGIGVNDFMSGVRVSFNSLRRLATDPVYNANGEYGHIDSNDVVNLNPPEHKPGTNDPNPKVKMGAFNFQKIADDNAEMYFGEWHKKDGDGDLLADTRMVYYSGKSKTTNMPDSGTAVYTVNGINNYAKNGLLKGTLTADFGGNTLKGDIGNNAMALNIDAKIAQDASFNGSAIATPTGAAAVTGTSNGHFFGDKASSLAGIAKFEGNRKYDTAFGGKKQ